jgi:hypothetical protein
MKKIFAFLFLSMSIVSFVTAQDNKTEQKPEIVFDKLVHDFGTIWDGESKEYFFVFTNKGNAPLILSNVQPSCGCTAPVWPKEPIMPGQKAKIQIMYNPGPLRDAFSKTISVKSNAVNDNVVLTIKGVIKDKPKEPVSPVKTQPAEGGF